MENNKYRRLRKSTRLSMQKFGDKYGIPMSTVRAWEMGYQKPTSWAYSLLERAVKEDFGREVSNMTIAEIWNEAYEIYIDTEDRTKVREYLTDKLGHDERLASMIPDIVADVVEAYGL